MEYKNKTNNKLVYCMLYSFVLDVLL